MGAQLPFTHRDRVVAQLMRSDFQKATDQYMQALHKNQAGWGKLIFGGERPHSFPSALGGCFLIRSRTGEGTNLHLKVGWYTTTQWLTISMLA
jgi:hypothetical protein